MSISLPRALAMWPVMLLLAACLLAPRMALAEDHGTVEFDTGSGAHKFDVEVVTTEYEKALGLMFRQHLAANAGMLFLYDQPQAIEMWMKNTYIPLDMVFIGSGWKVSHIAERAEPFSLTTISSDGPAIGVLEVPAGTARDIGLEPGDKVVYQPAAKPAATP